jgi:hypothetical protein
MRALLVLLLLPSCASRQETPEIQKIRKGETPDKLKDLTDRATLDAIADQIVKGGPASDAVKHHLCEHGTREHAEALFVLVEKEGKEVAIDAVFALAALLDEKLFPRVEKLLDGERKARLRALMLLTQCRMPAAAKLLEKRALLDAKDSELSGVALAAIGACRARGTHEAVLDYFEKTGEDAALKALGRIWETKLSAPALERADEIRRLTALVPLQKLAMSGASTELYCDAMLRVLSKAEFEKFLKDFAGERFYARRIFVLAAGAEGFDKEKGRALHSAFLANPDPGTVARILYASRFELPLDKVGPLLENAKDADIEELPKGTRVCDLAAWRLAAQVDRKAPELPLKEDALPKWKEWWAKQKK